MAVIKIKSTHKESQGDFVLIEEGNFNSEIHELYIENEVKEIKEKPIKDTKASRSADVTNVLGDK